MTAEDAPFNGDMGKRAVMNTRTMTWQPSPSGSVWRRRLHRVGPAESGQVTSIVRYEPGAKFPAHDHPEGEEIYVLDGVFSDEHGDWGPGYHLLNPEGFRHAPFSLEGCVIFVKLRQYDGEGRRSQQLDTNDLSWSETGWAGIDVKGLYLDDGFADVTRLERWSRGAAWGDRPLEGGIEIFVIEGELSDGLGRYSAGSWIRLPSREDAAELRSETGAMVYAKTGALPGLQSE